MASPPTSSTTGESGGSAGQPKPISICAWCGRPTHRPESGLEHEVVPEDRSGDRGQTASTHGICTLCIVELDVFPIESLADYDRRSFDDLPFGVVELDSDGHVLTYNRWEKELAEPAARPSAGTSSARWPRAPA